MMKKLLKYEMRASLAFFPVLLFALVVAYLLGLLAKQIRLTQMMGMMIAAMVVLGIAAFVVSIVVVVTRYHKGLFGAEGYLMQTLPVTKGQLIASKAIVAYLLFVLSTAALVAMAAGVVHLTGSGNIVEMLREEIGAPLIPFIIYLVVLELVQLGAMIGELYFAITLSNTRLFLKNNIVFSVLFFFAANFVVSLLEMGALMLIPVGLRFGPDGAQVVWDSMLRSMIAAGSSNLPLDSVSMGLGSIVVDLLCAVGLLVASRWLMTRKTSVK